MTLGALFGGESGSEYIKMLHDMAWSDSPETVDKADRLLDAGDAARGLPRGRKE